MLLTEKNMQLYLMMQYSTNLDVLSFNLGNLICNIIFVTFWNSFQAFAPIKSIFWPGANERLGNLALCTTSVKKYPQKNLNSRVNNNNKKSMEVLSKCSLLYHWLYRQGMFHVRQIITIRYCSTSSVM